jgi:hypothetical protein
VQGLLLQRGVCAMQAAAMSIPHVWALSMPCRINVWRPAHHVTPKPMSKFDRKKVNRKNHQRFMSPSQDLEFCVKVPCITFSDYKYTSIAFNILILFSERSVREKKKNLPSLLHFNYGDFCCQETWVSHVAGRRLRRHRCRLQGLWLRRK